MLFHILIYSHTLNRKLKLVLGNETNGIQYFYVF